MTPRSSVVALAAVVTAGGALGFVLIGNPPFKWAQSALPRNIAVSASGHSSVADGDGGVGRIVSDLANAAAWNGAGAGTLITTTVDPAPPVSLSDGISTMHFNVVGTGCSGTCLAVTLTPIPPSVPTETVNGTTFVLMTDSDIFFNPSGKFFSNDEPDGCNREYHLESVAVHEVGHLLGLGHTPVASATMYAFVSECATGSASIADDDVNGINCIYNDGFGCGGCAATNLVVDQTVCSIGTGGPNSGDFIVEAFIVDNCSGPAAGATVRIDVDSPLGALSCQAETDSGGRVACALDNPPDGAYTSTVVSVSKAGFAWPGTECSDPDMPCQCSLDIGQGGPTCGDGICEGDESTTCPQDCEDRDQDGIADSHDNCPDVSNSLQANADGDDAGDACDCDAQDAAVWKTPPEVQGVLLGHDLQTQVTTILWTAPADPGALSIAYDTIRSDDPADFGAAICLESGGADLETAEGDAIAPDVLRSFLIRAVNACPAPTGEGSLGMTSTGTPRTASACP